MLVEKYIDDPRHIEIQIIADQCGNTVYLPERECSIQRRNQKVIEEAPSPFIDPPTRKAMGEQAAQLARAVKYHTAGTVEMLCDSKRNFYFLEMNTRLQVEHPVTEAITNLDLVEEMLRAAKGIPLTITQDKVAIDGWATECRVYAEDPTRNYAPSIGRMSRYLEPSGPGVRVDSGITEGSEISVYYDPMIAKLITKGKDRTESITRMNKALDEYVVRGVKNNIGLMRDVLMQDRYCSGNISTKYLVEQYPEGFAGHELTGSEKEKLLATAAVMRFRRQRYFDQSPGSVLVAKPVVEQAYIAVIGDDEVPLTVRQTDEHGYEVELPTGVVPIADVEWTCADPLFTAAYGTDAVRETFQFQGTNEVDLQVQYMGTPYTVTLRQPMQHACAKFAPPKKVIDTSKLIQAPMPGAVVSVNVAPGDVVEANGEVCILEAMKMQQSLRSVARGVVKVVTISPGDTVDEAQTLVEFE